MSCLTSAISPNRRSTLRVVAEELGLGYEEVDYFPDDVEALIVAMGDRTVAVVNKNFPKNKQQRFTLAHELCHHYLHKDRGVLEEITTIDSPSPTEHDPGFPKIRLKSKLRFLLANY